MLKRPEIILKFAMTLDGFIDDSSSKRLILSNEEDKNAVQKIRDSVDAIIIGGNTVRKDNAKLLASNKDLKRVVFSLSGKLNLDYKIFDHKKENLFLACSINKKESLDKELFNKANMIFFNDKENAIEEVLYELHKLGVKKVLIEAGQTLGRMILEKKLFDQLRIATAPFFLGQINAVSAVKLIDSDEHLTNRLILEKSEILGNMVVSWYKLM